MPRVSKRQLDKQTETEIQECYSYLVSSLRNSEEIENFLQGFLTREEKLMLSKRVMLLMMIKMAYTTETIIQALNVSYETVRIYSTHLSMSNKLFHTTIQRLIKRVETREFLDKMAKVLKPLDLALRAKTDMRARAKIYNADYD